MGRLKARPVAPMIWGFVSKIRGSFLIFDPIVRRGREFGKSMERLKVRPVVPMILGFVSRIRGFFKI